MRALISVSDKRAIVDFAKDLKELGVDLISTGGTAKALKEGGLEVKDVSELTGFKECLDGRVKTLHPKVHAGILAMRDNKDHMDQLKDLDIETIDLVVVNLYPFKETILKDNISQEEAIENIDIGGPTMLRSAAKNNKDVIVLVDPEDYDLVIKELKEGRLSLNTRLYLAAKVFAHTAHYDTLIADYMAGQAKMEKLPQTLTMTYEKVQQMRYGENPHQDAAFYREVLPVKGSLVEADQLHGKELSFNNINDANGALDLLKEFKKPAVVAVKHANPCGVGTADNIYDAYMKAYKADPVSIFGGIIVANRKIDKNIAQEINKIFVEIVIGPDYDEEALEILKKKKNIRILRLEDIDYMNKNSYDMKKIEGGLIVQNKNTDLYEEENLQVPTKRKPTDKEMEDLIFAWKLVKHVKSNGISLAKDGQSVGLAGGQANRIWATKQAIDHGLEFLGQEGVKGSVMGSDAFFPFPDCVEEAVKAGITAIIQPGGSIRDQDSVDLCDEHGIAMVFTGKRHFKH